MTRLGRSRIWRAGLLGAASALFPTLAQAAAPMTYLRAYGAQNNAILPLLWALIGVSLFVVAVVGILLVIGIVRRWRVPHANNPRDVPPERPSRGLGWIYTGSALTIAALLGAAIWTFDVLAQVSQIPGSRPFSLRVVAHQWWWEVHYQDRSDPSRNFVTANEIHIPTGQPIVVELETADVIHSFWVPQLKGKMETIPNQNNETWIEADRPGTYRGECSEYCGLQHAHMAFFVMAEPQQQFAAWWDHQLAGAPPPKGAAAAAGETAFMLHCAACHAIRGTSAGGRLGPDLSHLMTRKTIAAGTLPNTVGYLSGWISDPQRIKPGNYMPVLDLSAADLTNIRNYLETLQ